MNVPPHAGRCDVESRFHSCIPTSVALVTLVQTKVMAGITKGACPWDIYSPPAADENVE